MKRLRWNREKWKLLPVIFALAWPTMLEQAMGTLVQYIDAAMVGSLGAQATAAVGATSTINWLVGSTVSALGVGFLSFIAKAFGAGDRQRAARVSSQVVLMTLLSGIVFTIIPVALHKQIPVWMQADPEIQDVAATYFLILYIPMIFRAASTLFGTALRAAGNTKTPMAIGVIMNLVNVVFNYFFINPTHEIAIGALSITVPGAGWGVTGAAIASAISYVVGGVGMAIVFWKHPVISPRGQKLKPDWEVLKPCLRVALPATAQRFGTSFGYVAFAAMINSLGTVSLAAHSIANTVESAFYIPGYGMQTAAATLTGNALGAKDEKKLGYLKQLLLLCEVTMMVVSGALLFIFAPAMMGIFTPDTAVIALGATVLRMVALSEPFYGISIVTEGMLQGAGDTKAAFVFNIAGMWGVRILGTFVCVVLLGGGLVSAWACMIGHNLLLCALLSYYFWLSKKTPLRIV